MRYDSFEVRSRELHFLVGAEPFEFGLSSLRLQMCGWDSGQGLPSWLGVTVQPKGCIAEPSSFDFTMRAVFDLPSGPATDNPANVITAVGRPIPACFAATQNVNGRIFGCFVAGTRIATERGEVAIEHLQVGDLVHTMCDGRLKPIVWIGERTIDCQRHSNPSLVWPVRISASAFGTHLPHTDLLLSPHHAVYWIDALIPVRCLLNGRTITQEKLAEPKYFSLELLNHDVILAEGMAVETLLDTGPTAEFQEQGSPIGLYPDLASRLWDAKACAPLIVAGPVLDRLRQWLAFNADIGRPSQRAKTQIRSKRVAKSA